MTIQKQTALGAWADAGRSRASPRRGWLGYDSTRGQPVYYNGATWMPSAPSLNVIGFGAKCDGATDDTAKIRPRSMPVPVSFRYVPPTVVCRTGQLLVHSRTTLIVDSTLKLLDHANATTTAYVLYMGGPSNTVGNTNNVLIGGIGTIDANGALQTASNFSAGVVHNGGSWHAVRDIHPSPALKNWPLSVNHASHVLFDNVKLVTGNSPAFANCTDCWARKMSISGINDESFAFYGGNVNAGISESYLSGGAADGISVLNDAGSTPANHQIIIANNFVTGMGMAGVSVAVGSGGAGPNTNVQIINNVLTANALGGVSTLTAQHVTIANNRIGGDPGTGAAAALGISLRASSQIDITENVVVNEEHRAWDTPAPVHPLPI